MKFHHIGYVVNNITEWEKSIIYKSKINDIFDPVQNATLALYKNFDCQYIELIQPLGKEAFTWNFLTKNGEGFHHLCYNINDLNELNMIIKKYKLIPILNPVPALLFNGKYVTFYYSRNKQIIEFVIDEYKA